MVRFGLVRLKPGANAESDERAGSIAAERPREVLKLFKTKHCGPYFSVGPNERVTTRILPYVAA